MTMESGSMSFYKFILKCAFCVFWAWPAYSSELGEFTQKDRQFLRGLAIDQLPPPTALAGNSVALNKNAAKLGKKLFFDTRLSANGEVSCASCHMPAKYFTDGRPLAVGIGATRKNTPSILSSAYSPWQFWDGRKDSMWAQALAPLEDSNEHGMTRKAVVDVVLKHYSAEYQGVFGGRSKYSEAGLIDIDQIFANVGKALMAYQYRLRIKPAPFDHFVKLLGSGRDNEAKKFLTNDQIEGLKIFVGKGNCISCHNGPLLSNFEFHNVGIPELDNTSVDLGRYLGAKKLAKDEFSCLSRFSSTDKKDCLEMKFLKTDGPELVGAFKTPSLRNVAMTAPYMHAGQFSNLERVVEHYNKPKPPFYDPSQHPNRPHFDILPLLLSEKQKASLVSFLKSLTSPIPKEDEWWN